MTISRPAELGAELVAPWNAPLSPGAPLTVEEGDTAIAMQNGRVLGVYSPGEHTLPAQVPADVRLYFVLTRPFLGLKFGGDLPALPPAPGGLPAPRAVFGDFAFRVTRPDIVLAQLLSLGEPGFEPMLQWARAQVLTACTEAMAEMMLAGTTPGDPANLEALVDAVEARAQSMEPHGIRLVRLGTIMVQ